jgi:hypothetical protein
VQGAALDSNHHNRTLMTLDEAKTCSRCAQAGSIQIAANNIPKMADCGDLHLQLQLQQST